MRSKIFTAPSEIDALVIKAELESENIKASVAPGEGSLNYNSGSKGPNAPHDIWVENNDTQKAHEIIRRMLP
jgi:hypothetical protein